MTFRLWRCLILGHVRKVVEHFEHYLVHCKLLGFWMSCDFDHHHNFGLRSNSIKDFVAAKCIWSTHMSSVSGLWAAAARLASFPAPFPTALYCGECQQSVCCLPAWAPSMCPTHFNRTQYIMNTCALNIYQLCSG